MTEKKIINQSIGSYRLSIYPDWKKNTNIDLNWIKKKPKNSNFIQMMIPSNIINLNFQFEYQRWLVEAWDSKLNFSNWIYRFFSLIHRLIAYRFVLKPEILLFSVRFIFFIILVGPIFCFVNCFWLFFFVCWQFFFCFVWKKIQSTGLYCHSHILISFYKMKLKINFRDFEWRQPVPPFDNQ